MTDDAATADSAQPTVLAKYDRALVAHFARWIPFGGPGAEQVYEEFGLALANAYRRVLYLSEPNILNSVAMEDRADLGVVASHRATLASELIRLEHTERSQ